MSSDDEIKTDQVTVSAYLAKKEDENKPHTIYTANDDRYSTFSDDAIPNDGIGEGDVVDIEWYQDGDYRTITNVEIQESGEGGGNDGGSNGESVRDGRMVRSVALKAAATCALERDSTEGIIDRAKRFEDYLRGKEDE